MSSERFLPYAKQSIDSQDIEEVCQALRGTFITRGTYVEAFEKKIAEYCGAAYAVAFSSGSAALAAAFFAAGAGPFDRILTSPNTFVSTVGTAMQFGSKPVFIDIDLESGNVDLEQLIENANEQQSRGKKIVVPVHFAGLPFDMEEFDRQLASPNVVVIEDAAHALGTSYSANGPKIGSCAWSDMTIFSFHPAKTITTGEGGIVTTNRTELYHLLSLFRNNGIEKDPKYFEGESAPWYYEVQTLSNNYNFTDFQAALGCSQLKKLDRFVEHRRSLIQRYREKLAEIPDVKMLTSLHDSYTAFHLCVALIDFTALKISRADLMHKLKEKGIGSQVHYIPLYKHPFFKGVCGDISDYFPNMENYYTQALSLPLFYEMETQDVDFIANLLKTILTNKPG